MAIGLKPSCHGANSIILFGAIFAIVGDIRPGSFCASIVQYEIPILLTK